MKSFFEVMAQDILPSVRALMAKKLLEHGFSQKETAERLGLTQPAISQYKRGLRGVRKDVLTEPKITETVNSLVKRVGSGQISFENASAELFDICKELFQQGVFSED